MIWTGAEYDVRDYRNYWVKGRENEQQNWFVDTWYDNPYFLAYEKIASGHHDKTNSYLTMSYDINDWLQAVVQLGIDAYANRSNWRTSKGATPSDAEWDGALGYYYLGTNIHYSTNNDFRLMADKRFGDFRIDGFIGGSLLFTATEGISLDGDFSLYPDELWIGYDLGGYPGPDYAELRVWSVALTDAQAFALGSPTN